MSGSSDRTHELVVGAHPRVRPRGELLGQSDRNAAGERTDTPARSGAGQASPPAAEDRSRESPRQPRRSGSETALQKSADREIILFADGAARGNPGPAAIGALLTDARGRVIEAISRPIGVATNNQAEYQALIAGLDAAARHDAQTVRIRMDSELVVRQLTGQYRVKHPNLKPLHDRVREQIKAFPRTLIAHVPRERNRKADALANAALDGRSIDEALRRTSR